LNKKKPEQTESQEERQRRRKTDMAQLCDYLYLGTGRDANNHLELERKNITAILNTSFEWDLRHPIPENIMYKKLDLIDCDQEDIYSKFEESYQFINEARKANKNVLVHCRAGKSRSPAIAISYLMKAKNMRLKDAYDFVLEKRYFVRPNNGFVDQLMKYERVLFDTDKNSLSIDDLPFKRKKGSVVWERRQKEREQNKTSVTLAVTKNL